MDLLERQHLLARRHGALGQHQRRTRRGRDALRGRAHCIVEPLAFLLLTLMLPAGMGLGIVLLAVQQDGCLVGRAAGLAPPCGAALLGLVLALQRSVRAWSSAA